MINKTLILADLLIVAILTLALAIPTTGNVNAKKVDSQAKFLTYQNTDFNFKIQYPDNLTKEEAYLPSHVIVRFSIDQHNATFVVSSITAPSTNFTTTDYVKLLSMSRDRNIQFLNATTGGRY